MNRPPILYVEDDPEIFRLAQLRLNSRYELIPAADDAQACAQLRAHGKSFFAVLMDVGLKGSALDGMCLVRLLRGLPIDRPVPAYARALPLLPNISILVLTADDASRHQSVELQRLGSTQFLTKPIDFTRLSLALAQANIQSVMAQLAPAPHRKK